MQRVSSYERLKRVGKCPVCATKPLKPGRAKCERCLEQRRAQAKRHYKRNRARITAYMRAWHAKKVAERATLPQAALLEQTPYAALPTSKEALLAELSRIQALLADAEAGHEL